MDPIAIDLEAGKGLESDRIAVLYPDRRLDYFADARWSGPLDQVLQDLAVQALRSEAGLRYVSADASAFSSGYWLEIEVADFQAEYASTVSPTIRVHLLARLGGSGDRRILGGFDETPMNGRWTRRLQKSYRTRCGRSAMISKSTRV